MSRSESSVVAFLGGKKALGMGGAGSAMNLHDRVVTGFPVQCAMSFKAHAGLTNLQASRILGVSEKTFIRWQAAPKKSIDAVTSDRLYRVARIMALAQDVLEDAVAARDWLGEAQIALAGRVPMDLIVSDIGARQVEELLLRMEHGYLA